MEWRIVKILLILRELLWPELEDVEVAVAWLDGGACEAGSDAFASRFLARILVKGTTARTPAAEIP